eukprot:12388149-Prorocentrum_lima.AAC.1
MTMLQESHLNTGSLHIASEKVLQALQRLHNKETHMLMKLDTRGDLHAYDYRLRIPEFRHVSDSRSA